MEDFDIMFNSHNPPITIPDEVIDVVDHDFDLPYSPPELGGDWGHKVFEVIKVSLKYKDHYKKVIIMMTRL